VTDRRTGEARLGVHRVGGSGNLVLDGRGSARVAGDRGDYEPMRLEEGSAEEATTAGVDASGRSPSSEDAATGVGAPDADEPDRVRVAPVHRAQLTRRVR
jgi:hypothetical protein